MSASRERQQLSTKPPVFVRADYAALERFDMSTKRCTMNCGPHRLDPRTDKERRYLCDDCHIIARNHLTETP